MYEKTDQDILMSVEKNQYLKYKMCEQKYISHSVYH